MAGDKYYPAFRLLKEALPFYLESFMMYFRQQGDNWIITMYLGPASLAVYYIAKTLYTSLYMLFQSIDKVFTQKIASHKHDMNYIIDNVPRVMRMVVCTAIPVVLLTMTLTPSLVFLVAGVEYLGSVVPAMICF